MGAPRVEIQATSYIPTIPIRRERIHASGSSRASGWSGAQSGKTSESSGPQALCELVRPEVGGGDGSGLAIELVVGR